MHMERIIGFIKTPPPTPIMDPNKPATRPTAGLYLRAFVIEASCERADDAAGEVDVGNALDAFGALDVLDANERAATVAAVLQRDRQVAQAILLLLPRSTLARRINCNLGANKLVTHGRNGEVTGIPVSGEKKKFLIMIMIRSSSN